MGSKIGKFQVNIHFLNDISSLLSSSSSSLKLSLSSLSLNTTNKKLPGVHIDSTLQFNKHIDKECKAISNKISPLQKKKYLNQHHRVLYYNEYIRSIIDYCLPIYRNVPVSFRADFKVALIYSVCDP